MKKYLFFIFIFFIGSVIASFPNQPQGPGDPNLDSSINLALILPINNSYINYSLIEFKFNVSSDSSINRCDFILNNIINKSFLNPPLESDFFINLTNGNYFWKVNCSSDDNFSVSLVRYFKVNLTTIANILNQTLQNNTNISLENNTNLTQNNTNSSSLQNQSMNSSTNNYLGGSNSDSGSGSGVSSGNSNSGNSRGSLGTDPSSSGNNNINSSNSGNQNNSGKVLLESENSSKTNMGFKAVQNILKGNFSWLWIFVPITIFLILIIVFFVFFRKKESNIITNMQNNSATNNILGPGSNLDRSNIA